MTNDKNLFSDEAFVAAVKDFTDSLRGSTQARLHREKALAKQKEVVERLAEDLSSGTPYNSLVVIAISDESVYKVTQHVVTPSTDSDTIRMVCALSEVQHSVAQIMEETVLKAVELTEQSVGAVGGFASCIGRTASNVG